MSASDLHLIVLAGGDSTRIKTGGPKALLDISGRPMLDWVLSVAAASATGKSVLVLGPTHREQIESWLEKSAYADWEVVIQPEPKGTGDAVRCALAALPEEGRVLILCGDTPLLQAETLALLGEQENGALLSAEVVDPDGYGRILRDEEGNMCSIIEQADCDAETAAIGEVNAGVYVVELSALRAAIDGLESDNAQGEFYLTEAVIQILGQDGGAVVTVSGEDEIIGVNSLADLARASMLMRERVLAAHMENGVIIDDPASTFIEADVEIGPATRIFPFCVIRRGCRLGAHCLVGPFAHLRGGSVMHDRAEIGNFVEVKNTEMGEGAKSKHLTYLGDTEVGAGANIGCGTITANYDGKLKHRTIIGAGAFIGSGTVLVAPVKVGDKATTGAGAVVLSNHDVAPGEVVVGLPAAPIRTKHS